MYQPLNLFSDHSLLYGYGTIEEYVEKSKEAGYKILGLSDKNTCSGVYEFVNLCKKNDLIPLPGVTISVLLREYENLSAYDKSRLVSVNRLNEKHPSGEVAIYSKTNEGLKYVFRLIEKAYERDMKDPYVTWEDIKEIIESPKETFIVIGLPQGEIKMLERNEHIKERDSHTTFIKENMDTEFVFWGIEETNGTKVKEIDYYLKEYGIKSIPFNPVFYKEKKDYKNCEHFMAIGSHSKITETPDYRGGKRPTPGPTPDRYLDSNGFKERFPNTSHTRQIMENINLLVENTNINFEFNPHLRATYPIPEDKTSAEVLKEHVKEGFEKIRKGTIYEKQSLERLKLELDVICGNDYVDYFLIVEDYCKWATENAGGIGFGRGSASGSEVGFLLGIHKTDPIKHELLFERFLSPGRGSEYTIYFEDSTEKKSIVSEKHYTNDSQDFKYTHQLEKGDIVDGKKIKYTKITRPSASAVDIDIDFNTEGREKVIKYLKEKYGENKVANVTTFNTFGTKNAFKSLCTIYDIPFHVSNSITKEIEDKTSFSEIFKKDTNFPLVRDKLTKIFKEKIGSEKAKELIRETIEFEGRIREEGVHACAIVISPVPLSDVIPMQRSGKDKIQTTQYDYPPCEALGLLKMDFLGLDTVDIIEKTLELIEENKNIKLTKEQILEEVDKENPEDYKLFQEGNTIGIFQYSSQGVQQFLKDLKPDNFKDLYAVTALYRPGPMGMGAHKSFVERKRDPNLRIPLDNKKFLNTPVEEVLEPTYGLVPFQETLMNLARTCAGFSPYETDLLRKATSKKKKELLESLKPKFLSGIKETVNKFKKNDNEKITDEELEAMWQSLEAFSSYSFNKCISKDTKIRLSNNTEQTIEELYKKFKESDEDIELISYDEKKDILIKNKIYKIVKKGLKEVYKVETDLGKTIYITKKHRMATPNGFGSIEDKKINEGKFLLLASEKNDHTYVTCIVKIEKIGTEEVYDIEMNSDGPATFIANGLISHNSHSVSYALEAFMVAYLKTHYPAEFMSAVIQQRSDKQDKLIEVLREARKMKEVKLHAPDVNISDMETKPRGEDIFIGLSSIKNISTTVAESICKEREENGKYKSLYDFIKRSYDNGILNKSSYETLAYTGGFSSLGVTRKYAIDEFPKLRNTAKKESDRGSIKTQGLFSMLEITPSVPKNQSEFKPLFLSQKELEFFGTYVVWDPLVIHERLIFNFIEENGYRDFTPIIILEKKDFFSERRQKRFIIVTTYSEGQEIKEEFFADSLVDKIEDQEIPIGEPVLIKRETSFGNRKSIVDLIVLSNQKK